MVIKLKIDNPDMEKMLLKFIKNDKEITLDTFQNFLNIFYKTKKFNFNKKDPKKHSRKINYKVELDDDLNSVKPYSNIKDSAEYIHNLRRQN